jgi:hypothetical protein
MLFCFRCLVFRLVTSHGLGVGCAVLHASHLILLVAVKYFKIHFEVTKVKASSLLTIHSL